MKNSTPTPQVRLQAKRKLLEQEFMMHRMRLQNNAAYAAKNIPQAVGAQIAESPLGKKPIGSMAARFLLPKPQSNVTYVSGVTSRVPEAKRSFPLEKVLSIALLVLPFFGGFARKRALRLGLKGVKGLLKIGVKRFFGLK